MARHIAQELSDSLNTSVIVQNKGGANGIIGTQAVASAKPDGYTILFTPNTPLSLNPLLRKNLPYSPTKDLEILSVLVESPIVVLARPQLGLKTLKDMASLAATKEGGLNYSAVSAPGQLTLSMDKIRGALGFDMTSVPYSGAGQAMNALLAGDVDISVNALGLALPQIKAGKATALAVGTSERLKELPEVETVVETIPDFNVSMWYSLSVPAGIPSEAREALLSAFQELPKSAPLQDLFARNYLMVAPQRSPAQLREFLVEDLKRWKKIIDDAGIKPV
jgi:tripartite-type tricarboxylate transporter receptor subunit TctC